MIVSTSGCVNVDIGKKRGHGNIDVLLEKDPDTKRGDFTLNVYYDEWDVQDITLQDFNYTLLGKCIFHIGRNYHECVDNRREV